FDYTGSMRTCKMSVSQAFSGSAARGILLSLEPARELVVRMCASFDVPLFSAQPEGSSTMLKLRNVEKSFETKAGKTYVLRRVNVDVQDGEFVTIMGPSGAGKSTMLGIVGMLDGAWTGEYYFLDQPVHKMNVKQRAELNKKYIGFVFQQYH